MKAPWAVHHENSVALLAEMDPTTIGAVVMDPPYGIAHSSNHGASWQKTQIAGDRDTSRRDAVIQWANAHEIPWACFGSWKRPKPEGTRGVLIWDKGPAFGMGDLSFPWKMSWEEIYIGGEGWSGTRDEGVLRGHIVVSWESKGRVHPHQKPVSLMAYLIRRLPRDTFIWDPFCGSGSTGVAAIQEGYGIRCSDEDQAYVAIARQRIADAAAQGSLFDAS